MQETHLIKVTILTSFKLTKVWLHQIAIHFADDPTNENIIYLTTSYPKLKLLRRLNNLHIHENPHYLEISMKKALPYQKIFAFYLPDLKYTDLTIGEMQFIWQAKDQIFVMASDELFSYPLEVVMQDNNFIICSETLIDTNDPTDHTHTDFNHLNKNQFYQQYVQ